MKPPRRPAHEAGAATVWALALLGVIMLAAALASAAAAQAVARQRVSTVADIAALAAAQSLADPCAEAERIAMANHVALVACTLDAADVIVSVSGSPPDLVRRVLGLVGRVPHDITATARAGPPDLPVSPWRARPRRVR